MEPSAAPASRGPASSTGGGAHRPGQGSIRCAHDRASSRGVPRRRRGARTSHVLGRHRSVMSPGTGRLLFVGATSTASCRVPLPDAVTITAPTIEPMSPLGLIASPSPASRLNSSPPTNEPPNPAINAIVQSTRSPFRPRMNCASAPIIIPPTRIAKMSTAARYRSDYIFERHHRPGVASRINRIEDT